MAALEWRIREDVPTNLRAVKKAAVEVGRQGVLQARGGGVSSTSMTTTALAKSASNQNNAATNNKNTNNKNANVNAQGSQQQQQQQTARRRMAKVKVLWDESETMAAYLKN